MEVKQQVDTLETEVQKFADSLPEWAKYLASVLLDGKELDDGHYQQALIFFKEDNGLLKVEGERPEIKIDLKEAEEEYRSKLLLKEIRNLKGVNALAEGQKIELSPNVTVVYGANGSGKTGYIRLLNNAFFSRSGDTTILPNINLEGEVDEPCCEFVFESGDDKYNLTYPEDTGKAEWDQLAVFDCKSVLKHLDGKKDFVFRPRAMDFFAALIEAYKVLTERFKQEIAALNVPKDFSAHFEGESEIQKIISGLSGETILDELKKHLPFSDEDKESRKVLEDKKTYLSGLKKNKDKEISKLSSRQTSLNQLISALQANNSFFNSEKIEEVSASVNDNAQKQKLAKEEGVEKFQSDKLDAVGSEEWKNFIIAADAYAKKQGEGNYPQEGDNCLFCQQSLAEHEVNLIKGYWDLLQSQVEEQAKNAQTVVDAHIKAYEEINFALLPEDSVLVEWMKENYSELLANLRAQLKKQEEVCQIIVVDLSKGIFTHPEKCQVEFTKLNALVDTLSNEVKELQEKNVDEELTKLNSEIAYLNHKEKLETHISAIEKYVHLLRWIAKAEGKISLFHTGAVTNEGKRLANKYLGQQYEEYFLKECERLNAHFNVENYHSGSYGNAFRELKISKHQPSQILSEGEQRAVSLADFLAEIQLLGINRGIVFDDPVNSLDEERKSLIAKRLVEEAQHRQVLVFTHDLVFLSSIIGHSEELKIPADCHWIEKLDGQPGIIHIQNTPSYEKAYKKSGKAQEFYTKALKSTPEEREVFIRGGFAALRTSYEALVIFDLFSGVVQRFNERVSVDSLTSVYFDLDIRDEILDSFYNCCRFMEGHSHSDKYAYKKPDLDSLKQEIQRFNEVKKKIAELKKAKLN